MKALTALAALLAALLSALPAPAQPPPTVPGIGESIILDEKWDEVDLTAAAAFRLAFDPDNVQFLPDTRFVRIPFLLEVAPKHKVYRNSVKLTLPERPGVALVGPLATPKGVTEKDPSGKTEELLKGVNRLSFVVKLDPVPTKPVRLQPTIAFQGCSDKVCFAPQKRTFDIEIPVPGRPGKARLLKAGPAISAAPSAEPPPQPAVEPGSALGELAEKTRARYDFAKIIGDYGYTAGLLVAFVWGLLVSLTPCVWPLIPIVVSVVGAHAEGTGWKRGLGLSLTYVVGMSVTYAVLGGLVAGAAQTANVDAFRRNPWLLGAIVIIFVLLALSMFGLFEIRLPAGLAAKLQKKRGTGTIGVLLTGLVSGLVASPCVTAPALALFAGVALLGNVALGIAAGVVFAFGMGTILVVAGTSSKAMQALPRSGAWMVTVKQVFGWVMLGVAIHFSQMVIGTTAYLTALGVFLVAAGVFLGAFRPMTPETTWRSKLLQAAGIVVIVVGALFFLKGAGPMIGIYPATATTDASGDIAWVEDAAEGLARAAKEHKPVVIDFTADWCVYCRDMERDVFSLPSIGAESRRFVMVRVDLDRDPMADELVKRYAVAGPPSYVFVPTAGRPEVIAGRIDADTFLELMKRTR